MLPSQPGLPSRECSSGNPDIPAQILPQVPACLELDLKTGIFARRMPRRGRVHFVPRYFRCTSVSRCQMEPDARPLSLLFQRHQGIALLNNVINKLYLSSMKLVFGPFALLRCWDVTSLCRGLCSRPFFVGQDKTRL